MKRLFLTQPSLHFFPISPAFTQHLGSSLSTPMAPLSFHHTVSDGPITKVFSDKDIQISPSQHSGVPNHLANMKVGFAGVNVSFLVPPITCSHENKPPKSRKPQTVSRQIKSAQDFLVELKQKSPRSTESCWDKYLAVQHCHICTLKHTCYTRTCRAPFTIPWIYGRRHI